MPTLIETVSTRAYSDQKPGTSGLRKKVSDFKRKGYLENFVQSVFNTILPEDRSLLVVGGDGRYFNKTAAMLIVKMAAANGFRHLIVGQNALLSTPAVSNLIRARGAIGGIVLSASHNPGGPDGDFGIKFNNASGSPAPETVTTRIFEASKRIESYMISPSVTPDLSRIGLQRFDNFTVEIVDPVDEYQNTMVSVFDFDRLKDGFKSGRLSICFDGMHAITGPYAKRILEGTLGAAAGSVINAQPLEDFGGGHPDPNLVHAHELVKRMSAPDAPAIGAASDGDGDRNLILGRNFFVSPSDSLAVLAAYSSAIPQFARGLSGVARSMPTSRAVDRVAKALGIQCYETPTGWKFFGNLLDAGLINLCGEESFGTGGDHVREKDGLWTVLAWLSVLAESGRSVEEIVQEHWGQFGRYLYCRHDYEGIAVDAAESMMSDLTRSLPALSGSEAGGKTIETASEFSYMDPVDGSTTAAQGIQLFFENGSRIVYRLSGTGTSGATLRVYLEQYRTDGVDIDALAANAALGRIAAHIASIERFTGFTGPTLQT